MSWWRVTQKASVQDIARSRQSGVLVDLVGYVEANDRSEAREVAREEYGDDLGEFKVTEIATVPDDDVWPPLNPYQAEKDELNRIIAESLE